MKKRRSRFDDVLFISALAALLLGIALLLYTTGTFDGVLNAWPFLVMAAGGVLLYMAFVRGSSFYFLFAGIALVMEGSLILVSIIVGWTLIKAWPIGMAIVGLSGLIAGLASKKKMKTAFAVPSISFVFLGLAFSIFSLGWAGIGFKNFIVVWWPTLLIAGGISLFVVYGLSRRGSEKSVKGSAKPGSDNMPAGRSGRDRGPTSGT